MCAPMVAQGTRSKIQELYELAKEHLNDGPPSKEAAAAISKSLGDDRSAACSCWSHLVKRKQISPPEVLLGADAS